MKRFLLLCSAAAMCALLYGCDKNDETKHPNFEQSFSRKQVTASPLPLQVVEQDQVRRIPVSFRCEVPARLVPRKALFTLTPILVCGEKEYMGTARTWQGDRTVGGNDVISYDKGARLFFADSFGYTKEMDSYELYLAVIVIEDLRVVASYRILLDSNKLQNNL